MKKLISFAVAGMFALSLAACGSSSSAAASSTESSAESTAASTADSAAADSDLAYLQNKGKMTIGYTVYEPMNYTDESGTFTGFDTELATAVCEKLGVEPVMLETLLAEADAVSLHVPLTPDTRQLFDAGRLARMKPGAVLINTARGGIVEEAALADALRSGRLAGAMVDVFEKEPLPAGSPLADVPNCLLTPHIAGVTRESNVRVSAVVARKVAECLRGAA